MGRVGRLATGAAPGTPFGPPATAGPAVAGTLGRLEAATAGIDDAGAVHVPVHAPVPVPAGGAATTVLLEVPPRATRPRSGRRCADRRGGVGVASDEDGAKRQRAGDERDGEADDQADHGPLAALAAVHVRKERGLELGARAQIASRGARRRRLRLVEPSRSAPMLRSSVLTGPPRTPSGSVRASSIGGFIAGTGRGSRSDLPSLGRREQVGRTSTAFAERARSAFCDPERDSSPQPASDGSAETS